MYSFYIITHKHAVGETGFEPEKLGDHVQEPRLLLETSRLLSDRHLRVL